MTHQSTLVTANGSHQASVLGERPERCPLAGSLLPGTCR